MPISLVSHNIYTSYNQDIGGAKRKSMIVRIVGYDRKMMGDRRAREIQYFLTAVELHNEVFMPIMFIIFLCSRFLNKTF